MKLGTRVAYKHDARLTGIVVGFCTIHNAYDPIASGDAEIEAAIVRVDGVLHYGDIKPSLPSFHMPIELTRLVPVIETWVIYSDQEAGFWSNDRGWTTSEGATRFASDEHNAFRLPLGDARWMRLDDNTEEG